MKLSTVQERVVLVGILVISLASLDTSAFAEDKGGGWFSGWFSSGEQKAPTQQQTVAPPKEQESGWFSGWFSSSEQKAPTQQQQTVAPPKEQESGWFSGWFSSEPKSAAPNGYESQIDRKEFNKQKQSWWKSEPSKGYSEENQQRMKQGKAPLDPDGKPMELHHVNGQPTGPIVPMTRQDHREGANYQKNHPWLFDPNATPQKYQNYGSPSPTTGAPKNQWVNGYTRKDGTQVNGYWRSQSQK